MSPEEIAAALLGLPEVTEEEPFEPGVPVYKVAGKVFAICQPDPPARITLKSRCPSCSRPHTWCPRRWTRRRRATARGRP
jgi:predicted DNA-binding protein (MmcQ/YjbR family)